MAEGPINNKEVLTNQIRDLLEEFHEETGMLVTNIEIGWKSLYERCGLKNNTTAVLMNLDIKAR